MADSHREERICNNAFKKSNIVLCSGEKLKNKVISPTKNYFIKDSCPTVNR